MLAVLPQTTLPMDPPPAQFTKLNGPSPTTHAPLSRSEIVDLSRYAITRFLTQTGLDIRLQPNPHAATVNAQARSIAAAWDIGDCSRTLLDAGLTTGVTIATMGWACTNPGIQLHMALFTAILVCIDEFACPRDAVAEFADRMLTGRPQAHPLLERMADIMRDTPTHFLPLVSNEVNRSLLASLGATTLERDMVGVPLHSGARNYVFDKRKFTGIGRGYAFLSWDMARFPDVTTYLQAVPELDIFMNYVNDLCSFYKEELAGETENFVHERARVTGKSVPEALNDTVDEAIASTLTARKILGDTPEGEVCEAIMAGYTRFHLVEARYRLIELFGSDVESLMAPPTPA